MQEFFLSTILSEGWNMTGIGHLGWHLKIINICLWLLLTEEEVANCWKWKIAWSGCHLMKNSLYVGSKVCRSRHLGSMVLVSLMILTRDHKSVFLLPAGNDMCLSTMWLSMWGLCVWMEFLGIKEGPGQQLVWHINLIVQQY